MELQDIPHGREMNAASRDQLHEKELINNDFLARHGEVNIQENTDLEEVSEDKESCNKSRYGVYHCRRI